MNDPWRDDVRSTTPTRQVVTRVVVVALVALMGGGLVGYLEPFPQLRFAIQRTPEGAPSSRMAPREEVARNLPLLSITIDDRELWDPVDGIIANVQKRGRDWERRASVSYYENGRLRFASGVGLRIHGGLTRVLSPRKSFRLYFRREYGATQLPDDVLFDGRVDPIRRLVVHNDVREEATGRVWHFVNPLAYDITRRIGAYAPWTQPVRLFLNGEWRGVYILTEQVRDTMIPELLIPRFGHADFATDNRSYDELHAWVQRLDPLRMEAVAERVDLDNLTRWFLSVLFCATEDAFQGAQLLDRSRPAGGWFWINWDMDHAFMDYNRRAPVPWEHDTFSTTLERVAEAPRGWRESEVRATLLTTLLAEDEAYRDYFKRIFVEVMNHRLTTAFLRERFDHYATLGRQMGRDDDLGYLDQLEQFLVRRPAVLREHAEVYLNTAPSVHARVRGLGNGRGTVDGRPVPGEFSGYYFPDMTMTLAATDDATFRHWLVDGDVVTGPYLELRVERDVEIDAVFR